ncbi:leucyl aminopeptidase [Paenibacillus thalictri]|uniref:Probable cytosol aminopeptidase n=1 Tax=Paenibacillus thalictri TaxID=2527873 RepID=A0A4Q9DHL6_9BACL|nr:leucyl aminopeptidase [Paenibacillus thalictri]TBL70555.1 leucyl aminopeptidase [Paenibacillus thalictri]
MPVRTNAVSLVIAEAGDTLQADALILYMDKESVHQGTGLHPGLDEELARLRERGLFTGEAGQTELLPGFGLCGAGGGVLLAGLGVDAASPLAWRAASVYAARALLARKLTRAAAKLAAGGGAVPWRDRARAVAEGLLLGGYRMPVFRLQKDDAAELREAALLVPPGDAAARRAAEDGLHDAVAFAEGIIYARDLTNLPGNMLLPEGLAQEARALAAQHGLECTVLDEQELAALGMGGLAAVGRGSANPPRMIALRYQGRAEWNGVIGLVGKGVTFDTGGISLKKAEGMEEMISDMGGAAVLLGALHTLCLLRPAVNVVVVIPAAENMPSGDAMRPGDVITSLSGHTIEVLNTDAEGRVVLADGMTYAKQLGAEKLIDVATLTGAVLVALGDVATGAIANDEAFLGELLAAANKAGEKVWAFPNYPEYQEMLKSSVADIKNATSHRWAGSIAGGLFIGFFAGNTPWIHFDTGGTAWLWDEKGTEPKGGTGALVRTIAEWILESAEQQTVASI